MTAWKQALRSVKAQWISCVLAFCLIFASSVSVFFFFMTLTMRTQISEKTQEKIPLKIRMASSDGTEFQTEDIEKVLSEPHVTGCELETNIFVQPVTFENYVSTASRREASVLLQCNYRSADAAAFLTGNAVLSDGRFPDEGENGVVIDCDLASHNGLSLGDEIVVEREGRQLRSKILGIYRLSTPFQSVKEGVLPPEYENTPFSRIFAGRSVLASFDLLETHFQSVRFYTDSEAQMQETIERLNRDFPDFSFQNGDDYVEATLRNTSKTASALITLICSLLLVLGLSITTITLFWIASAWGKENTILRALGYPAAERFKRYIFRMDLFVIPAVFLPAALCTALREQLHRFWVWYLFEQNMDLRFSHAAEPLLRALYTELSGVPVWMFLSLGFLFWVFIHGILVFRFFLFSPHGRWRRGTHD